MAMSPRARFVRRAISSRARSGVDGLLDSTLEEIVRELDRPRGTSPGRRAGPTDESRSMSSRSRSPALHPVPPSRRGGCRARRPGRRGPPPVQGHTGDPFERARGRRSTSRGRVSLRSLSAGSSTSRSAAYSRIVSSIDKLSTIGVLDAPDETLVHEGHEPLENADATERRRSERQPASTASMRADENTESTRKIARSSASRSS